MAPFCYLGFHYYCDGAGIQSVNVYIVPLSLIDLSLRCIILIIIQSICGQRSNLFLG